MITINVTNKQLNEVQAQGYVILCEQGKALDQEQQEWCKPFFPQAQQVLDQARFTGAAGSSHVITGLKDNKPVYLIFAGYGKLNIKKEDRLEHYRRALGNVIRAAERFKLSTLAMPFLHAQYFDLDDAGLAKETAIIFQVASYHFDQFMTDKKRHINQDYTVTISAPTAHHNAINVGVEMGQHIGHAVNQARQWCDLPPNVLTPSHLAEQAEKIAHGHDRLSCKVLTGRECSQLGMGGVEAVSRGSAEDARFVIMEYKTDEKNADTVALVGKGVCFDSGGLSIKPAGSMEDMKDDMAGAAAVIATMQAIAHVKPKVNVVAVTPIVENMPDGNAFRPGDIIGHYNGMTSEVRNTDAEGRLILADALSYVEKHHKPDAIIDIATLTGSCSQALGSFFAGLMSKHDDFANHLIEAGKRSGDWLWPLPFHDDYRVAIKSDVADVCNISKPAYRAGAIMAGFFLAHFVSEKTPWIHLDIAGTSYNIPDRSYLRPVGGSGFGVRLFVDILMNWKSL
jgi:leucyl aminopeptidase